MTTTTRPPIPTPTNFLQTSDEAVFSFFPFFLELEMIIMVYYDHSMFCFGQLFLFSEIYSSTDNQKLVTFLEEISGYCNLFLC